MKTLGAVLGMFLCATAGYAFKDSALRRAWLEQEKHEDPMEKPYIKAIGEDFVMSERWKNYQKTVAACPQIGEVVRVRVSKTTDGGDYVVTMYGVDYHASSGRNDNGGFDSGVCSFWTSGESVTGISGY